MKFHSSHQYTDLWNGWIDEKMSIFEYINLSFLIIIDITLFLVILPLLINVFMAWYTPKGAMNANKYIRINNAVNRMSIKTLNELFDPKNPRRSSYMFQSKASMNYNTLGMSPAYANENVSANSSESISSLASFNSDDRKSRMSMAAVFAKARKSRMSLFKSNRKSEINAHEGASPTDEMSIIKMNDNEPNDRSNVHENPSASNDLKKKSSWRNSGGSRSSRMSSKNDRSSASEDGSKRGAGIKGDILRDGGKEDKKLKIIIKKKNSLEEYREEMKKPSMTNNPDEKKKSSVKRTSENDKKQSMKKNSDVKKRSSSDVNTPKTSANIQISKKRPKRRKNRKQHVVQKKSRKTAKKEKTRKYSPVHLPSIKSSESAKFRPLSKPLDAEKLTKIQTDVKYLLDLFD